MAHRRRSKLKKFAFALIPAILLWGMLELGLRLAGYSGPDADLLEFTNNHRRSPGYVIHPQRFWAYRPNNAELGINSMGMRGPDLQLEKRPGVYRIICLGDSVTFGFKIPEADSYPRQLERFLNERLPASDPQIDAVEVINAGVVGYSSLQGMRYLEGELSELQPDMVLVNFGSNDQICSMTFPDAEQPIVNPIIQKVWLGLTYLRSVMLLRQGISGHIGAHRTSLYQGADCEGNPPRVGPGEYEHNLRRIADICSRAGARVWFLPVLERTWDEPRCIRTNPYYPVPEDLPMLNWLEPFNGICGDAGDEFFIDGTHFTPAGAGKAALWISGAAGF